MSPKEKASNLIYDFTHIIEFSTFPEFSAAQRLAKKCAVIAANEMLNNAGFIWGGRDTETALSARDEYRKYWNEVKQEIEKP